MMYHHKVCVIPGVLFPGDQIMSCIEVETEGVMEGHWNPAPLCAGQAVCLEERTLVLISQGGEVKKNKKQK